MEKAVMYSLGNLEQLPSSSPSHSKHFNERRYPSLSKRILMKLTGAGFAPELGRASQ